MLLHELAQSGHNGWHLQQLRKQLRSRAGVLPFVGAGLSRPFGFRMWTEFLLKEAEAVTEEARDVVVALLTEGQHEQAATRLAEAYHRFRFDGAIAAEFGRDISTLSTAGTALALLPRLTPGPVVTTNFDRALEKVYAEQGKPFQQILKGSQVDEALGATRAKDSVLLKIHGDWEDAHNRILTREEYERAYGDRYLTEIDTTLGLPKLLRHLFERSPALFLGCSLNLDRTVQVLKAVSDQSRWASHYAVLERLPDPKQQAIRDRFLSEHNVQPIWYPPGQHDAVRVILEYLLSDDDTLVVSSGSSVPPTQAANTVVEPAVESSPVASSRRPARILHLTDLRLHAGSKLPALWNGIDRALPLAGIQFVVISGNLVKGSSNVDYQAATLFLSQYIDPLVKGDRARVIIVPGDTEARGGLDHFERFLKDYQGNQLNARSKRFSLSATGARRWSVHHFPKENISFYGFDSSARRGPSATPLFNDELLAEIDDHASMTPARSRIAVWHHGLLAQRSARDSFEELGTILGRGFNLVIHGQTHCDDAPELLQSLQESLPVVSAGSFGASSARDSRQIGVIEWSHTHWSWQTWSKRKGPWVCFRTGPNAPRSDVKNVMAAPLRTRVQAHHRTLEISDAGIAKLTVELLGVRQVGALPLVELRPGFTKFQRGQLEAWRAGIRVTEPSLEGPDGTLWLEAAEQQYDKLSWTCHFANGHALEPLDIACGIHRPELLLSSDEDAILHRVRFETEHLHLRIVLPPGTITGHNPIAQRCDSVTWVDADVKSNPPEIEGNDSQIALSVHNPKLDHRYGFSYRLRQRSPGLPERCRNRLDKLLDECRCSPVLPGCFSERLTTAMLAVYEHMLTDGKVRPDEAAPRSVPFFVGRLWSERARRLLPAFGNFPPETWGASFAHGSGIAGHAFRFRKVCVWVRSERRSDEQEIREGELVYETPRSDGEQTVRNWIIEVPLLFNESRAVGTIGFADAGPALSGSLELERIALRLEAGMLHDRQRLDRFTEFASSTFWKIAAEVDRYAEQVYEGWKGRGGS